MTATISSPLEVKRALLADARLAITDPVVTVRTGHPGTYQPGDLVSFTDLELSEGFGPMGNRRQRDVEVRVTMVVSIIRGGGEDQEEVAEDRCWELIDAVCEYVRTVDPSLGGRAINGMGARSSASSAGSTDPSLLADGRVIEASVVFTVPCRISS